MMADDQTEALRASLRAVNKRIPVFVAGLVDGSVAPETQAEFGWLLVQLGELVQDHARERSTQSVAAVPPVEGGERWPPGES